MRPKGPKQPNHHELDRGDPGCTFVFQFLLQGKGLHHKKAGDYYRIDISFGFLHYTIVNKDSKVSMHSSCRELGMVLDCMSVLPCSSQYNLCLHEEVEESSSVS